MRLTSFQRWVIGITAALIVWTLLRPVTVPCGFESNCLGRRVSFTYTVFRVVAIAVVGLTLTALVPDPKPIFRRVNPKWPSVAAAGSFSQRLPVVLPTDPRERRVLAVVLSILAIPAVYRVVLAIPYVAPDYSIDWPRIWPPLVIGGTGLVGIGYAARRGLTRILAVILAMMALFLAAWFWEHGDIGGLTAGVLLVALFAIWVYGLVVFYARHKLNLAFWLLSLLTGFGWLFWYGLWALFAFRFGRLPYRY